MTSALASSFASQASREAMLADAVTHGDPGRTELLEKRFSLRWVGANALEEV